MKSLKKLVLGLSFALLLAASVAVLHRTDVEAANQVTGLVQRYSTGYSGTIAWNTVDGASGYMVTLYDSGKKPMRVVKGYPSGTVLDGLNPGASYYVMVQANGTNGALLASSTQMEIVTRPGSDTSFWVKQTKSTATSVTLQYKAMAGANYYEIDYKSYGGETKTTGTTGTTCTLSKLSKNKDVTAVVYPARKSLSGYIAYADTYKSFYPVVTPSKPGVNYVDLGKNKKEAYIAVKDNSSYYRNGYKYPYRDGHEYQIYRLAGNKKLTTKTTTSDYFNYTNKYFAKKLKDKDGGMFKIRVRAYSQDSNNKKFYSGWSSWYYFCRYDIITSLKNKGSKGMEVKWNKVNKASGYKIYVSDKKKSGELVKPKCVKTITKGGTTKATFNKYNKKALKNGKKYYVYVEPYYKEKGKVKEVSNYWISYMELTYRK